MTMPNGRRIPQDGYKNHGGYVSAVSHAVNTLVQNRLYDPYLGTLYVAQAAQADYPLITSSNLGEIMRNYPEQPMQESDLSDPGYVWNEETQQWELPEQ